jgi:hypothetical protein
MRAGECETIMPVSLKVEFLEFLSLSAYYCLTVFRIHDISEWIRIRGSMPLTKGSGSCVFRH